MTAYMARMWRRLRKTVNRCRKICMVASATGNGQGIRVVGEVFDFSKHDERMFGGVR